MANLSYAPISMQLITLITPQLLADTIASPALLGKDVALEMILSFDDNQLMKVSLPEV